MYRIFFLAMAWMGILMAEDIHVDVKDYNNLPKEPTEFDALVGTPQGTITETKASFNPTTGILAVPGVEAVQNTSVFVPDLDIRYLWNEGYWLNPRGYYWNGNNFVEFNDPLWRRNWNTYWHGPWHNGWGEHWNRHFNDANWRWHQNRDWRGRWGHHGLYHRNRYGGHRSGAHHVHHHRHVHHHVHHHHGGGGHGEHKK